MAINRMRNNRIVFVYSESGFTMLELMVSLAVAAILLIVGVPSFLSFIKDERIFSTQDNTLNALNFARLTAVSDDTTTQICPYNTVNSSICGNDWSKGWVVFENTASGAVQLKAWQSSGSNGPTLSLSPSAATITFNPTPPYVNPAQITEFKLCDSRGSSSAVNLELQPTGYVQSSPKSGFAIDGSTPLTCP